MRIIKKGNIDRLDPTRKFTCYYCGCEFEYKTSELNYQSDQRENDAWYEIDCPTCSKHLILH